LEGQWSFVWLVFLPFQKEHKVYYGCLAVKWTEKDTEMQAENMPFFAVLLMWAATM